MGFASQPLNPTPFQKTVASRLRNRPFLYFGVPFLSIVVLASYGLQEFTKTRYEYHDTKVQTVSQVLFGEDRKETDPGREFDFLCLLSPRLSYLDLSGSLSLSVSRASGRSGSV